MAEIPPVCDYGWQAKDFSLPGTDGEQYSLGNVKSSNGLLLMFICNHCPYVIHLATQLVHKAREFQDRKSVV